MAPRGLSSPLRIVVLGCWGLLLWWGAPITGTVGLRAADHPDGSADPEPAGGEDILASRTPAAPANPATTATSGAGPATNDDFRLSTIVEQLKGADAKVAALAAHRLLQVLASGDGAGATRKAEVTRYLLETLDPKTLEESEGNAVVATRIVDALATWITSSGPPFAGTADLILPLVGSGPPALREAVVRTLQALLRHETSGSSESPTLMKLKEQLSQDKPSSFLRDASEVLWKVDGKALIGVLVGNLAAREGASHDTEAYRTAVVSLEELRRRIPRGFSGVEGWKKWWAESQAGSLEEIISRCWQLNQEAFVANWKQLIRRLRETADAERLLLAIQDTLGGVYSPALRTEAARTLGEFADWLSDMPIPGDQPEEAESGGSPKDRLLRRGVELLVQVLKSDGFYAERRSVVLAALVALRRYHGYLDRNAEALAKVSDVMGSRIQRRSPYDIEGHRDEVLETVLLAGALRLQIARGFVESLLTGAGAPNGNERPAEGKVKDIELLTAAVLALGRIVENEGLNSDGLNLLLHCFQNPPEGEEAAVREFRRACVTALGTYSAEPGVGKELFEFHSGILAGGDNGDLRIPAILALGTLAQRRDGDVEKQLAESALKALLGVIANHGDYEPQEVLAAVDSIAYVGNGAALAGFLELAVSVKDAKVREQIRKKTVGLIRAGKLDTLAHALEELERRAIEKDNAEYYAFAGAICGDVAVKELVQAARQASGNATDSGPLLRTILVMARVQDFQEETEDVTSSVNFLLELGKQYPALKEKFPEEFEEVERFSAALEVRGRIGKILQEKTGDISPAIQAGLELLQSDPSLSARRRSLRWFYSEVSKLDPTDRRARICQSWAQALQSAEAEKIWEGLPPQLKERYLENLSKLKDASKPPKPPEGAPAPEG